MVKKVTLRVAQSQSVSVKNELKDKGGRGRDEKEKSVTNDKRYIT